VNVAPLLARFPEATVEDGFGPVTVDVPADAWSDTVQLVRDTLGCGFFDFLSAVDEGTGVRVVCHLVALQPFGHLLLRSQLPGDEPAVASVAHLYAGAAWHERETAEMFGVRFLDAAGAALELDGLLLPPGHQGHPLRKDQLLTARVDRPWPGAKEPGESDADVRPSRRRLRPPGVPAPTRGAGT
jgi:NADH:ubiquinone oxidoreductase subunit C